MKIVCISGKAQHGKDTSAEFLKQFLADKGYSVLICHYGDLVKYVCKAFFNWNGEKDEAGRRLLQYVGTDVVREKDPDYWVFFLVDMMRFFGCQWDYVLIPECRFPNEVELFRDAGFDVTHLRVIRENFDSPLTPEQRQHISETALDNYRPDCWVYNDGSLSDLQALISKFAESLIRNESERSEMNAENHKA